MALFKVQLFKSFLTGGREWTNVYIVNAVDLIAATTAGTRILQGEVVFHKNQVVFTKARISDLDPLTSVFHVVPLSVNGNGGNAIQFLPLFNTVRVDLTVNGFGRPSRKYYRLPLIENDVNDGAVEPVLLTAIETELNDMIADLTAAGTPLVDPDAQLLTQAVPFGPVQMRQLHRKRRRTPPAP